VRATQEALAMQATQAALDQQAQSLQATQTAIAQQPTLTPTGASPVVDTPSPSATPIPAFTATPANTPVPSNTPIPQPTSTAAPCTNIGAFMSENWKDDTKILAGQFFYKRWTVQNTGTCTWTADYKITSLDATTMGIRPSILRNWRMPKEVKPGENVEIVVEMWAPFGAGSFEAHLMLVAPGGAKFGVGAKGQTALSARLAVVDVPIPQQESGLSFGAADWVFTFDAEPWRWALDAASDDRAKFTISDGHMTMLGKKVPTTRWIIGTQSPAYSQFVQATFTTGPACAAKDSYGLVLRAEDIGGGVFNRAYVFKFSCDGSYRLYYMNDGKVEETIPWTASALIKAGPNQANRMSVLILGGKMVVYANGEKVVEVQNQTPGNNKGYYGLAISTDQTENLVVTVDDFKLWRLDEWLK
jgi:hypothetical protein